MSCTRGSEGVLCCAAMLRIAWGLMLRDRGLRVAVTMTTGVGLGEVGHAIPSASRGRSRSCALGGVPTWGCMKAASNAAVARASPRAVWACVRGWPTAWHQSASRRRSRWGRW